MFINSLPIRPSSNIFPFSRANSNEENYHIKKRKSPSKISEVPIFLPPKNEPSIKKSNLNLKNDNFLKKKTEKRDFQGSYENEKGYFPSKKIHTSVANKGNTENVISDSSENSNSSKKSSKYFQKYLNKIKVRQNEFVNLDSCVKNNKLSFLPYFRCQDTQFHNMIIPVLPKALFDAEN